MLARLLCIFAHPDDESLLAGGTLAACAARGHEITIVSATKGEAGPIADPSAASRDTLASVREGELRAAGHVLGAAAVHCLNYPDGELSWLDPEQIKADLSALIHRIEPMAVITFGPEGLYWHPDHIAIHEFTRAAVDSVEHVAPWIYYATWPDNYAERLVAAMAARGLNTDLWGLHEEDFGVPAASITTTLDVSSSLPAKLQALRCYRSQFGPEHLFSALPDDIAQEFLGREYFVCVRPGSEKSDWLHDILSHRA